MMNVRPAGQASRMSICGKNFNVAIFSDAMNIIYVKLCMMVVLNELYTFIPFSVILIVFIQGYSTVKQFQLKMLCSYMIKLKLCMIIDYVK